MNRGTNPIKNVYGTKSELKVWIKFLSNRFRSVVSGCVRRLEIIHVTHIMVIGSFRNQARIILWRLYPATLFDERPPFSRFMLISSIHRILLRSSIAFSIPRRVPSFIPRPFALVITRILVFATATGKEKNSLFIRSHLYILRLDSIDLFDSQ